MAYSDVFLGTSRRYSSSTLMSRLFPFSAHDNQLGCSDRVRCNPQSAVIEPIPHFAKPDAAVMQSFHVSFHTYIKMKVLLKYPFKLIGSKSEQRFEEASCEWNGFSERVK